jgi:hypothetical protein
MKNETKIRFERGLKLKFFCLRHNCKGVLIQTPEEILAVKPPLIRCPKCNNEFSSGRRMQYLGDQVIVIAQLFEQLIRGTGSFDVELILPPLVEKEVKARKGSILR